MVSYLILLFLTFCSWNRSFNFSTKVSRRHLDFWKLFSYAIKTGMLPSFKTRASLIYKSDCEWESWEKSFHSKSTWIFLCCFIKFTLIAKYFQQVFYDNWFAEFTECYFFMILIPNRFLKFEREDLVLKEESLHSCLYCVTK